MLDSQFYSLILSVCFHCGTFPVTGLTSPASTTLRHFKPDSERPSGGPGASTVAPLGANQDSSGPEHSGPCLPAIWVMVTCVSSFASSCPGFCILWPLTLDPARAETIFMPWACQQHWGGLFSLGAAALQRRLLGNELPTPPRPVCSCHSNWLGSHSLQGCPAADTLLKLQGQPPWEFPWASSRLV